MCKEIHRGSPVRYNLTRSAALRAKRPEKGSQEGHVPDLWGPNFLGLFLRNSVGGLGYMQIHLYLKREKQ